MNWKIDLDEFGFLKVTCEGDYSVTDCCLMIADIVSQIYWRPGSKIIVDYRDVTFKAVGIDDLLRVREFHEAVDDRLGAGKVAFLMNRPVPFALGQQFERLAERKVSMEMQTFYRETDAIHWLLALSGGQHIN